MRVKSEKKSSKVKSFHLKLTLLLFGVITGLFLGEMSVRLLSARKIIILDNSIQADTRIFSATRNYTHKPFSSRVNQLGETRTSWFINSLGFRDNEYLPKKPKNTLRLLVLGDSLTFGLGVEGSESFPKILEADFADINDKQKITHTASISPKVQKYLSNRQIQKVIYVPGKIINFVLEKLPDGNG